MVPLGATSDLWLILFNFVGDISYFLIKRYYAVAFTKKYLVFLRVLNYWLDWGNIGVKLTRMKLLTGYLAEIFL